MKIVIIVTAGLALLLGGCMQATLTPVSDPNFTARDKQQLANPPYRQASIPPAYQRQVVPYHRNEAPGSILVDTDGRFVYYVLPADSDEIARAFRDDVARCSDMMSP